MTDHMILATDLDGTFLGGTEHARQSLYDNLKAKDEGATLIFVTGRGRRSIEWALETPGLPQPDYIIGDVGASIMDGKTLEPVHAVQNWVEEIWADSGDRVEEMLADEPGLSLQHNPFERRVAYRYDPNALNPDIRQRIEGAGFDCIISDNTFLDVMPRGVAKGPTLLRLLALLNLSHDRTLVAGDTLNDISLFQTGLKGVAVQNSETALVDHIRDMDHVYHSPHEGAAGIADALHHFALAPDVTHPDSYSMQQHKEA
ncbi:MAG: HAD-IIB family hydrolase [Pseudomonadota bacterium]